jgi:hypothetical protein
MHVHDHDIDTADTFVVVAVIDSVLGGNRTTHVQASCSKQSTHDQQGLPSHGFLRPAAQPNAMKPVGRAVGQLSPGQLLPAVSIHEKHKGLAIWRHTWRHHHPCILGSSPWLGDELGLACTPHMNSKQTWLLAVHPSNKKRSGQVLALCHFIWFEDKFTGANIHQ